MIRATFEHSAFLNAARDLLATDGPTAVTVNSVTAKLGAPSGSFYYRFASRDMLMAELWLVTALSFQKEYVAAIKAGDGLAAALHTPCWVRANPANARVFLLYHRNDFVHGEWPKKFVDGVRRQGRRVEACYKRFARDAFGGEDSQKLRLARFILAGVPMTAVIPHIQRGEPPPPDVDEMIATTYQAIIHRYGQPHSGKK
jgi:AcrR family transcriptional regulator